MYVRFVLVAALCGQPGNVPGRRALEGWRAFYFANLANLKQIKIPISTSFSATT